MSQKIIKVGSSAAVTLSPDVLEKLKVKVGDSVEVSAYDSSGVATLRRTGRPEGVNPDVLIWTNAFIDKNRKLLERLADK